MSRVVHPGLDALVQGPVLGGHLVPQPGVDGGRQRRRHAVAVLPQVREVRAMRERSDSYCESNIDNIDLISIIITNKIMNLHKYDGGHFDLS